MEQFPLFQKYSEAPLIPDFPKAPSRNFWREIFKPEFCWTKGGKKPRFFKSQRDLTAEVLGKSMKARTEDSVLGTVKNSMNLQIWIFHEAHGWLKYGDHSPKGSTEICCGIEFWIEIVLALLPFLGIGGFFGWLLLLLNLFFFFCCC